MRVVAFAAMGQRPAQDRALGERRGDADQQLGVVRRDARAMAVTVDLDQRRDRIGRVRGGGDRLGLRDAVEDHGEIDAAPAQRLDARQLVGRDPDSVGQVSHPGVREGLGLFERRDHGRAARRRHQPPRDLDRFAGLQMRPERDAGSLEPGAAPRDVAHHPRLVEDQARGLQRRQDGWVGLSHRAQKLQS